MAQQVLARQHAPSCRFFTTTTAPTARHTPRPSHLGGRKTVRPTAAYRQRGGDSWGEPRYQSWPRNPWAQAADVLVSGTMTDLLKQLEKDFGVQVETKTADNGRSTTYTAKPAAETSTAIDCIETSDDVVYYLDVPGLDKKDLKIQVNQQDRTLTVSGERFAPVSAEDDTTAKNIKTFERRFGKFSRSVSLPETADCQLISAKVDKGVLRIKVLKQIKHEPEIQEVEID